MENRKDGKNKMKKLVSVLVVTMMLLACVSSALATYGPKGDVGGVYHDQIEEAMYAWGVMKDRTMMPDLPWQKTAANLGTILGTGKSIKFVQKVYTPEELAYNKANVEYCKTYINTNFPNDPKIAEYQQTVLDIEYYLKGINASIMEIQDALTAYILSLPKK